MRLRWAHVSDNLVGERLGQTVHGHRGEVLLAPGTVLTRAYLRGLAARGYNSVCLLDPLAPEVAPNEALRDETLARASGAVGGALRSLESGGALEVAELRAAVDDVLDDLRSASEPGYQFAALRSVDDYQLEHAVHCCAYALVIAMGLGWERSRLRALGIGALLQNVGNVHFPEYVRRAGPLQREEFEALKAHTTIAFDQLRRNRRLDILSAHMAFQHHERLDGSGYPRGLAGDQVVLFGRVAAVADVFDAITSDRPYRGALPLPRGMALLAQLGHGPLDGALVRRLAQRVALYPNGSIVRLAGGEVAVVVRQTSRGPGRPRVRLLTDTELRLVEPCERELTEPEEIAEPLRDYPEAVQAQLTARG